MATSFNNQSKAWRAARSSRLLAGALLTAVFVAHVQAQDEEPLDLRRLIFEVAPIPADDAAAGPAVGTAGAAAPEGIAAPGPGAAAPADLADDRRLAADISAYRARIADILANENPYSAALREQYDALGRLLQETGNHEDAIAAFESAMHIDRVNAGLYTLEQIPLVENIIESHEALGNVSEVNDLHAYLFYIQQKSYAEDDPRLLQAKENWADWNVESYLKEVPERGAIAFGPGAPSTLDRTSEYVAVQTRDGSFVYVPRTFMLGAMNPLGNQAMLDPAFISSYGVQPERVIDERLNTARDYYEDIIEAKSSGIVPSEAGADADAAEAYRIELKLANVAYAVKSQLDGVNMVTQEGSMYYNRALGTRQTSPLVVTRGYTRNRETLEAIAQELEQDPSVPVEDKAQAYIRLGDWHVAYDYNSRSQDAYRKAWELLRDAGLDAAAIADIFMPQPLVPVPGFVVHPYSREMYGYEPDAPLDWRGHMDLSLNVNRFGDINGIDIEVATPGTLQIVRTELLDYLRKQKVRPAVVDGETVKRDDVKLRYYYTY